MTKARASDLHQRAKGRLLLLVFFLLLLYVVLPRLGDFSDSVHAITGASWELVALAVGTTAVTYPLAAAIYQNLALKRLHYRRTLLVQAANGFANRLLPAGIGGLTLNVQYLRKSGHTLPQALVVAGTNNLVGIAGHLLLLVAIIVLGGGALLEGLELPHISNAGWIALGVGAALLINVLVFRRLRHYLYRLTADIAGQVLAYRRRPRQLLLALCCSLLLTSGYVLTLYLCAHAVGAELSLGSMFAVFTVGMIATTATPTPGGLGGAEAGLVAGLVAYGIAAPTALAAALLYRLLTYWLPLLPGFAVFLAIRKTYIQ